MTSGAGKIGPSDGMPDGAANDDGRVERVRAKVLDAGKIMADVLNAKIKTNPDSPYASIAFENGGFLYTHKNGETSFVKIGDVTAETLEQIGGSIAQHFSRMPAGTASEVAKEAARVLRESGKPDADSSPEKEEK